MVMESTMLSVGVGRPSPFCIRDEGASIQFGPSGIDILFCLDSPVDYERKCFKAQHPSRIGIAAYQRLGALLFDFGEQFAFDAPFDAGLENPSDVLDLSHISENGRLLLTLIGIDTRNNHVFGLRTLTLSPRVTQLFAQCIRQQMQAPTDKISHQILVNRMYERYPTLGGLKRAALAFDKAGV